MNIDTDLIILVVSYLFAFGIGLGTGSFATMPYYRLPQGIACAGKWVGKKSACPKCGAQLRTRDLVPVFNWLGTMGKCFSCGTKITPMYFFIELSISLLSVALFAMFGFTQFYILGLIIAACLVIMVATDIHFKMFPNAVLLSFAVSAMLLRVLMDGQLYTMVLSLSVSVLIAFAGEGLYEKRKGKKPENYSYLKLIGLSGIVFGPPYFIGFMLLSALLLPAAHLLKNNTRNGEPHVPYGIAFVISFIVLFALLPLSGAF